MGEANWVEFVVVWGKNLLGFELVEEERRRKKKSSRERGERQCWGGGDAVPTRSRATCRNY